MGKHRRIILVTRRSLILYIISTIVMILILLVDVSTDDSDYLPDNYDSLFPRCVADRADPKRSMNGNQGKAVTLPHIKTIKKIMAQGLEKYGLNEFASDLISLCRDIPDYRHRLCVGQRYSINLPETSVIICFHNEAWSVLARTVHSVLDRSHPYLLKEVILVDDFSDMDHLKGQLDDYWTLYSKVRIIRTEVREGLIGARLLGAQLAEGPILTFLDSSCEVGKGWLEPLMERIQKNPTTIASPIIDSIDGNTFEFIPMNNNQYGGFNWSMGFIWVDIPERVKKMGVAPIDPFPTPTILHGIFSIHKDFFKELGAYDTGLDSWGRENLELSFKLLASGRAKGHWIPPTRLTTDEALLFLLQTWMCGGRLEFVPCSHVGRVSRNVEPHQMDMSSKVFVRNSARIAMVWMDEYAKYYFERIGYSLGNYGEIINQKQLRRSLGCKTFKWYVQNVYPELQFPPKSRASGEIQNLGTDMCIDAPCDSGSGYEEVCVRRCHSQGGNQFWIYTEDDQIARDNKCLYHDFLLSDAFLYPCNVYEVEQKWRYDNQNQTIQHVASGRCMTSSSATRKVRMKKCANLQSQKWTII